VKSVVVIIGQRASRRAKAILEGSVLDDREKLHQKKKAEEAARLERAELLPKAGRPKERDFAGRDASQNRLVKSSEPGENYARGSIRITNTIPQQEPEPNMSIKRSNTGHLNNRPDQEKPSNTKKSVDAIKAAKAKSTWTKNSDKILLSMKLHYMRTRDTEKVIHFLYGTNMDGEWDVKRNSTVTNVDLRHCQGRYHRVREAVS
jgi:hypothetical protein